MELLRLDNNSNHTWLNHDKESVYILAYPSISAIITNDHDTWFLPRELNYEEPKDDYDD